MILSNQPWTGALFLPTLGLAACIFIVGYWFSKEKEENEKDCKTSEENTNDHQLSSNTTFATKKKKSNKKHTCGCGSNTNQDTTPPNQVNIFYGTVTGKSKVLAINFFEHIAFQLKILHQKFAEILKHHAENEDTKVNVINLKEFTAEETFTECVSCIVDELKNY